MATIASALNASFPPAAGDFIIQAIGPAPVSLQRKNTSGAAFADVVSMQNQALVVSNPVAGAIYQFVSSGNSIVQADQ